MIGTSTTDLEEVLASAIPRELAEDLITEFRQMRADLASRTLGRVSVGKFIETLVQCFEFLEGGMYSTIPDVDRYLKSLESRTSSLPDGLRICASRIGRAMYSLRSKRSIAHKNEIDPNTMDLALLVQGAQWILSELVRTIGGLTMDAAGRLIEQIQLPAGSLVEDFGDKQVVLVTVKAREEILILLHNRYPTRLSKAGIVASVNRFHRRTVEKAIDDLWENKLVEDDDFGYVLTRTGRAEAAKVIRQYA